MMDLGAIHKLALDLSALSWAFAFSGRISMAEDAGVLSLLVAIGREVDQRIGAAPAEERIHSTGSAPKLTGQYDGYHVARESMGMPPNMEPYDTLRHQVC